MCVKARRLLQKHTRLSSDIYTVAWTRNFMDRSMKARLKQPLCCALNSSVSLGYFTSRLHAFCLHQHACMCAYVYVWLQIFQEFSSHFKPLAFVDFVEPSTYAGILDWLRRARSVATLHRQRQICTNIVSTLENIRNSWICEIEFIKNTTYLYWYIICSFVYIVGRKT